MRLCRSWTSLPCTTSRDRPQIRWIRKGDRLRQWCKARWRSQVYSAKGSRRAAPACCILSTRCSERSRSESVHMDSPWIQTPVLRREASWACKRRYRGEPFWNQSLSPNTLIQMLRPISSQLNLPDFSKAKTRQQKGIRRSMWRLWLRRLKKISCS